jgi:hypothetical protein
MTLTVTPTAMPHRHPPAEAAPTVRHRSVNGRRTLLLAAIHHRRGVWTTGRARHYYATALSDQHVYESSARRDLLALYAAGHLDRHEKSGRVSYTLKGGTT